MNHAGDILITGGGIVGLSAALGLHQRGYRVALVDSGPLDPTPNQRVYAINRASQRFLQQLGVWEYVDTARLSPYQRMHIWDAANNACLDFDARLIGENQLGLIVEELAMKHALLQLIQEQGIALFPHHHIHALDLQPEHVVATSDTTTWHAKTLLIAEGAFSSTRQLLNVEVTSWPYHQHALVATVQTEKTHQQTAYQVFRANGPLAFLPLASPNHCSIVWSTSPQHANLLMELPEDEFNHELTQAFAHTLGQVNVLSQRHSFPLIMRHVQRYADTGWLLMGDAAHTIHPLAGLGLNLGLADVACWLSILDEQGSRALRSKRAAGMYQRQRKQALWKFIVLMDALKTTFSNPLAPCIMLRGTGLNVCNQLNPLKRFFIEQAAG